MPISTPHIISISMLITLGSFFFLGTQIASCSIDNPSQLTNSRIIDRNAKNNLKSPLPDFTHIYNTQEKKQLFFSYLKPIVDQVNNNVRVERRKILALKTKHSLTSSDRSTLEKMAKKYRVAVNLDDQAVFFKHLLTKVDQIPPSLVLAQAANESAWGTSRFAIKGNNLFGQWCFSKGCGLVPERRDGDSIHEVTKFSSVFNSVESYVLNLNRHAEYSELRSIRYQLRQSKQRVNGTQLAEGLSGYSERGQEYVDEIQSMIRFNNLSSLDKNS